MKTDVNGCSTCPAGGERYEEYYSPTLDRNRVQYEYRTWDGTLFTCIANSLVEARDKRDRWLWQWTGQEE